MHQTVVLSRPVPAAGVRNREAVARVGFVSAVLTTGCILAFDLAAAGSLLVPMGAAPILASLLIAPAFLALVASVHACAPEPQQLWTQLALSFATIYAAVVSVNYVLQLTVLRVAPIPQLALDPGAPHSIGWMFELLGYSAMVLAGLCLVPVFAGGGSERWIRRLLIANAAGTLVGVVAYGLTVDALHVLVLADLLGR